MLTACANCGWGGSRVADRADYPLRCPSCRQMRVYRPVRVIERLQDLLGMTMTIEERDRLFREAGYPVPDRSLEVD
jgi:hypothetical protein